MGRWEGKSVGERRGKEERKGGREEEWRRRREGREKERTSRVIGWQPHVRNPDKYPDKQATLRKAYSISLHEDCVNVENCFPSLSPGILLTGSRHIAMGDVGATTPNTRLVPQFCVIHTCDPPMYQLVHWHNVVWTDAHFGSVAEPNSRLVPQPCDPTVSIIGPLM